MRSPHGEIDLRQANRKKQTDPRRRILKRLAYILGVVVLFLGVVYGSARLVVYLGQRGLYDNANSAGPQLGLEETAAAEEAKEAGTTYVWQEGWIRYDGEIYAYNEDILTFLVLGIDKGGEVTESRTATSGGQSDAMFLLILNPHTEQISIYAIDRNTMTDIKMVGMGENGTDITATAQLAVQHGFGDGEAGSCELTRDAVSALFYDLPIHGYISVNYEAIPRINDAVGGVEVTITEDAAGAKKSWKTGDVVLLEGQDAIKFVKWRDTSVFESARMRSARQKTYLTSFIQKAMEATKQDITMPITLYNEVKDYTVTDITVDEMSYLVSEVIGYSFSGDQIYAMPGETLMGETYEEFYPDMDALRAQMIEIFYEKVEDGNE